MTAVLIVLSAVAVGIGAGLWALRAEPRPLPRRRAVMIFAIGFVAWPVVAALLLFFGLIFLDFWLNWDEVKKFWEEGMAEDA